MGKDPFPPSLLLYAILILAALLLDTLGLIYLLVKIFR